jgi:hypothetical protein
MLAENVANKRFYVYLYNCWREKIKYFSYTYLLIGHIAESERGKKEYFNSGL